MSLLERKLFDFSVILVRGKECTKMYAFWCKQQIYMECRGASRDKFHQYWLHLIRPFWGSGKTCSLSWSADLTLSFGSWAVLFHWTMHYETYGSSGGIKYNYGDYKHEYVVQWSSRGHPLLMMWTTLFSMNGWKYNWKEKEVLFVIPLNIIGLFQKLCHNDKSKSNRIPEQKVPLVLNSW